LFFYLFYVLFVLWLVLAIGHKQSKQFVVILKRYFCEFGLGGVIPFFKVDCDFYLFALEAGRSFEFIDQVSPLKINEEVL
jgi:hypothetical protein